MHHFSLRLNPQKLCSERSDDDDDTSSSSTKASRGKSKKQRKEEEKVEKEVKRDQVAQMLSDLDDLEHTSLLLTRPVLNSLIKHSPDGANHSFDWATLDGVDSGEDQSLEDLKAISEDRDITLHATASTLASLLPDIPNVILYFREQAHLVSVEAFALIGKIGDKLLSSDDSDFLEAFDDWETIDDAVKDVLSYGDLHRIFETYYSNV